MGADKHKNTPQWYINKTLSNHETHGSKGQNSR